MTENVKEAELRFADGSKRIEQIKDDEPKPKAVIRQTGKPERVFHFVGVQNNRAIYIEELKDPPEPELVREG